MRTILHVDLNNFYASVECLENPSLRDKAVVVCGRIEDRHGVVIKKNMKAKQCGIKTGDTLWQARNKCPEVVGVEARHNLYLKYSRIVRKIYLNYTDRIEPFGIDEAWLDISESVKSFEEAQIVADKIREQVRQEVGITISVGISFCKVFAKLGSDLKKPDATTLITPQNYKELVWNLPVSDLLYVGRATNEKLNKLTIKTIGDLAGFDPNLIAFHLGKVGQMLQSYAKGEDESVVKKFDEHDEIKSVGNSMTYYKDIISKEDIYALFLLLCESVVARMKSYGFNKARNLVITVTDNNLNSLTRMTKMTPATDIATEIADYAFALFEKHFAYKSKVRALGIHVSDFVSNEQISFADTIKNRKKQQSLQEAVEKIRQRFGRLSVQRAIIMRDPRMKEINIIEDHVIHPKLTEDAKIYTQNIYNLQ